MYPGLSPLARVHAPLGPDLIDYLSRIARYNQRPDAPTNWIAEAANGDLRHEHRRSDATD
jgi:hypothetical protein